MTKNILYVSKGISKERVKDQINEKIDLIILEDPNIFGDKGLPNKVVPLGDFFKKAQFKEMEDISKSFPEHLAKCFPEKFLKHRNINLIELVRRNIEADVLMALPVLFSQMNLLDRESPRSIIYLGSKNSFGYKSIKNLSSRKNIKLSSVNKFSFDLKEFKLILNNYRHTFPIVFLTAFRLTVRLLRIRNKNYKKTDKIGMILFAPSHPNHVSFMVPIVRELKNLDLPVGTVLFGRSNHNQKQLGEDKLIESNTKYVYFEGFLNWSGVFIYLRYFWSLYNSNLDKIETFKLNVLGFDISDVFNSKLKTFVYFMMTARLYTDLSYKVLEDYQPRLLVVVDDTWAFNGKTLVEVAKTLGIKTLVFQHGMLLRDPAYHRLNSDYCFVWGDSSFYHYVKSGIDKSRIKIVGAHILGLYKKRVRNKSALAKKYSLSKNQRVILFTSQNVSRDISQAEKDYTNWVLFNTVKKFGDTKFVYRPHPIEKKELLLKLFDGYRNKNFVLDDEGDLEELIALSDVVVTVSSTTALDAIILGRPVVSLNVSSKTNLATYVADGAVLEATSGSELYDLVNRILKEDDFKNKVINNQRKFLKRYISKWGDDAKESSVKTLLEIYESSR